LDDVNPLLDYWRHWPPAHIILAQVYRKKPEPKLPDGWPGSGAPTALQPTKLEEADTLPPPSFIESLKGIKVNKKRNG